MTETQIPNTRLSEAFAFAAWIHQDQYRKQAEGEDESLKISYLTHLAEVLAIVIQGRGNEDQQIAALLHDAIEDQPTTPNGDDTATEIKRLFGERALELVLHCTDGVPDASGVKPPWRDRKEKHIQHMNEQATKDPEFLLVSIADKISNAQAIVNDAIIDGPGVWNRFNAPPTGVVWYYTSMLQVFSSHLGPDNYLVKRLTYLVQALSKLAPKSAESDSKQEPVEVKPLRGFEFLYNF